MLIVLLYIQSSPFCEIYWVQSKEQSCDTLAWLDPLIRQADLVPTTVDIIIVVRYFDRPPYVHKWPDHVQVAWPCPVLHLGFGYSLKLLHAMFK